jgi:hypothetical protein
MLHGNDHYSTVTTPLTPWGVDDWERPEAFGRHGYVLLSAISVTQFANRPTVLIEVTTSKGETAKSVQLKMRTDEYVAHCREVVKAYDTGKFEGGDD